MTPREVFAQKRARAVEQLAVSGPGVRLAKDTSNLFRDRRPPAGTRLDLRAFNQVLEVNAAQGWVDVEGMTPYDALTDATLQQGTMPAVVPELKSITIGGAAAGVGIEATSFRQGLVHESLSEIEVLTGDGRVLVCTPDGAHRDLFFGFPSSYGTLGYCLRLKARTVPVRPYVEVVHHGHRDSRHFFEELAERCAGDADFVDGVVFGPEALYINEARFVGDAPGISDYSFQQIYYRSIRTKPVDYLKARDYIWRWDTDWFWCSKNLGAQNPLVRRLLGRKRLNSRFYTRVMRWSSRWGLTDLADRLRRRHAESVIQDVDIPIERAEELLSFLEREIGIRPVWICPVRSPDPNAQFDLYPLRPETLYVNFGFWDRVTTRKAYPPGHFNRLIERKVSELGGIKSLYSASYFPEDEFWGIYNGAVYRELKAKYDPNGRFEDLYAKCVRGA
jgi:FAD/FMN-containing dehydrogenase